MTNADRLIAEIQRRPGASDGELRVATGIGPHQQVNQICHRLAEQGDIVRRARADGRIGNFPAGEVALDVGELDDQPPRPAPSEPEGRRRLWFRRRSRPQHSALSLPTPASTVVIVPCSKAKRSGGVAGIRPVGLAGRLPTSTRDSLITSRQPHEESVHLDERLLLPAVTRYDGHLYAAAGPVMRQAAISGQSILIMSGYYGVLDALDPIGTYERAMHASDWPKGLLERAVVDAVRSYNKQDAVVFCSRSTDYATIVRRAPWNRAGLRCWLVAPDSAGRGGAQRAVPTATGEAIVAYLDGRLATAWSSSGGLAVTIESLS